MAKNLKEALADNAAATEALNRALRACLAQIKDAPEAVAETRLRLVSGGRRC